MSKKKPTSDAPKMLTAKKSQAAVLVAEDELTDEHIAEQLGVSRSTLASWKRLEEFITRVDALIADMAKTAHRYAIARVDRRMARREADWRRLRQIVEERAAEAVGQLNTNQQLKDASRARGASEQQIEGIFAYLPIVAPGMTTGHVVRVETPGKFGTVVEFRVDTGLLAAINALESEAAKDAGQLIQRLDVTSGGKPLAMGLDLTALSEEELDRRLAQSESREAAPAVQDQS